MKKRIHINQHNIRANSKDAAEKLPVISVKTYKQNHKVHAVEIMGPSTVVYSPNKPLACGAKVWIETNGAVMVREDADLDIWRLV